MDKAINIRLILVIIFAIFSLFFDFIIRAEAVFDGAYWGWFVGSFSSAAFVIIFSLFGVSYFRLKLSGGIRFLICVIIGSVIYEILQICMPGRVFDPVDVFALMVGGILSLLVQLVWWQLDIR